ncbi:MAG: hypothetical protein IPM29_15160 [Planctomycetes bacterium]|nr:hypothetical protein [Planctomycetota bacterium]
MVLAALASATFVDAQSGVAPPAYAEHWGNHAIGPYNPLSRSRLRWQQLYEPSALPHGVTPGQRLSGLGWRPYYGGLAPNAPVLPMEIRVFDTALTRARMSSRFADNLVGASGGVVFARRTVSLPPITSHTNPADGFVMFLFDAPHTFRGPGLLVEVENSDSTTWMFQRQLDGCREGVSMSIGAYGTGCGPTTNFLSGTILSQGIRVGLASGPPDAPAAAWFGTGILSAGPFPLPLQLDPFGMPGCLLFVRPDIAVATTLDSRGNGEFVLPIVDRCYSQWAAVDPAANPAGLSWSNVFHLQDGAPPCAMSNVWRDRDYAQPVGYGPDPGGMITRFTWH